MSVYFRQYQPEPFSGYKTEFSFEPKEGFTEAKYAMDIMYSDVEPFEIIEQKGKKLLVRGMECRQTAKMAFTAGGFVGHTENSQQKWEIESDPEGRMFWISLRKDGVWRRVGSQTIHFSLGETPIKFYDYNF